MARLRDKVIRAGFEALHFSGAHEMLRRFCGGVGTILTFHHVRPSRPDPFQPNGLLEVTPEFLAEVIGILRHADIDLISLDEMHRRLVTGDFERRFACITFDDGYRDNKVYAYPVLKRHDVPFAVYVPTSFIERRGELWWLSLEAVIASTDRISIADGGPATNLQLRFRRRKTAVIFRQSIGGCAACNPTMRLEAACVSLQRAIKSI